MKQILWLRASGAGLSLSKIDAVNYDDQVVALLHPPSVMLFAKSMRMRCLGACMRRGAPVAACSKLLLVLFKRSACCMLCTACVKHFASCAAPSVPTSVQHGHVGVHEAHGGGCVCHLCCLRVWGLDGLFVRFVIPFCLDTLALQILPCTCSHGADFALKVIKQCQKIRRIATTLPCLKDFAMLILRWMSVAVMAESHLFCHREI